MNKSEHIRTSGATYWGVPQIVESAAPPPA
jgi:hypothetical protein